MILLYIIEMKRRFLILLSTIFALAAISLVLIQVSQTRKSASLNESLFTISVNNAIDDVFAQLDQMKVEEYMSQKERYQLMQYRRIDEMNEKMQEIIRNNSDLFYDEDRVLFGISTQDSAYAKPHARLLPSEEAALSQYNTLLNARNRFLSMSGYSSDKYKKIVAGNSIDPTKLNYPLLDSLIREELIINGAEKVEPFIGVWESDKDTMMYCSQGADSVKLKNTPFKYIFKTHGMMGVENLYVVLTFKTSSIILGDNAKIYTLLSMCMILLITFLFIFSIRTIWSQRKLDEMKTDFINNMTHEIKTPIATIGLTCEMLKDPSISSDANSLHNFVNIISDENRRMRVLVETLLQSAKMSGKKFQISPKEIDLNGVVDSALQSFQLSISNRRGQLETDIRPIDGTLFADELHISNMMHNLIDNAIKYSTGELYLKVSTYQKDGFAVVEVADHGIGIAKEDQKHIFEKFYRVSTGNVHDVKGFGIGLNYVSQVVALHKGKISVDSELGIGSTFRIELPLM